MDVIELMKGIALVVDDEYLDKNANISKIIGQIEHENIPIISYSELPNKDAVESLSCVSFAILDWRLSPPMEGVRLPASVLKDQEDETISFIKHLSESHCCPIFVTSNENKREIEERLIKKGIDVRSVSCNVSVRSKNSIVKAGYLFKSVERWLKKNSSAYTLRIWERAYQKSKAQLFSDFYKKSTEWPTIMWDTFDKDGVDKSKSLGDVINNNLRSRMQPYEFSNDVLGRRRLRAVPSVDIRAVLSGEIMAEANSIHADDIATGDLFKWGGDYYINIRASCDLFARGGSENTDDIVLYLLKGSKLTSPRMKSTYDDRYGKFTEKDNESIIFPIYDKAVSFQFKELHFDKWGEIKSKRVGRIFDPHILRIQERYANYSQRTGLPRTPKRALPES